MTPQKPWDDDAIDRSHQPTRKVETMSSLVAEMLVGGHDPDGTWPGAPAAKAEILAANESGPHADAAALDMARLIEVKSEPPPAMAAVETAVRASQPPPPAPAMARASQPPPARTPSAPPVATMPSQPAPTMPTAMPEAWSRVSLAAPRVPDLAFDLDEPSPFGDGKRRRRVAIVVIGTLVGLVVAALAVAQIAQ